MFERDDMPGMAADSCSLRNVSVAGNGWLVWKSCVIIIPFADTTGGEGIVGAGYMSYH